MLESLRSEFATIDNERKLSRLYEQDDKYSKMLDYAVDDEIDELSEITVWIFNEILKLK